MRNTIRGRSAAADWMIPMLNIVADTHTHTLACDHAYATLSENAAAAAKKGLKFLVSTEHTPMLKGSPSQIYFTNLHVLPRFLDGVMIIRGAEVNIIDYDGHFDLPDHILDMLVLAVFVQERPGEQYLA